MTIKHIIEPCLNLGAVFHRLSPMACQYLVERAQELLDAESLDRLLRSGE